MNADKDILSIDANDELVDYISLSKHLKEDTDRKKKKTISEIEEMGGRFLNEIDQKKKQKNLKKNKLIPYIMNHERDKYELDELNSYSFEDVRDIYNEAKAKNRPTIVKFFHFLFNLE